MVYTNFVIAALLASSATVLADCECGFITSDGDIWRESTETVFNNAFDPTNSSDWNVQNWTATADQNGGPLGTTNEIGNVFVQKNSLNIQVKAHKGLSDVSTPVSIGEIDTTRQDILFGSFRVLAKAPSQKGTCSGFFTYTNDHNEGDIEILSAESSVSNTHYSHQPDHNPDTGDAIPGTSIVRKGDKRTTRWNTHRMDWFPTRSTFFFNGGFRGAVIVNNPREAAAFILNHWSNGNSGWSRGPPTKDARLQVKYAALYYNSTSVSDDDFVSACQAAISVGGTNTQCYIDENDYVQKQLGQNTSPIPASASNSSATITASSQVSKHKKNSKSKHQKKNTHHHNTTAKPKVESHPRASRMARMSNKDVQH